MPRDWATDHAADLNEFVAFFLREEKRPHRDRRLSAADLYSEIKPQCKLDHTWMTAEHM
jgi:hypothetical protein